MKRSESHCDAYTIGGRIERHAIVESDQIFTTSGGRVIANKSCDRSIMIVRSGRTIEWRSNRSIGSSTRPAGKRVHTNRWHGFLYRIIYRIYAVTVHASSRAFPWCNVLCHCLHRVALHQLHRVETPSHQCAKRCTTQIDSRYETASASVFASLQENSSEAFLMLILRAPCLSLYWKKNDIILQSNTVGKERWIFNCESIQRDHALFFCGCFWTVANCSYLGRSECEDTRFDVWSSYQRCNV